MNEEKEFNIQSKSLDLQEFYDCLEVEDRQEFDVNFGLNNFCKSLSILSENYELKKRVKALEESQKKFGDFIISYGG